jgi:hypothetical protein
MRYSLRPAGQQLEREKTSASDSRSSAALSLRTKMVTARVTDPHAADPGTRGSDGGATVLFEEAFVRREESWGHRFIDVWIRRRAFVRGV